MNKFIKHIVEAFDFNSVNKQNKTITPYNILLPKICRIIETSYNKLTADDKSFIRSIKDNMPIYKVNNKKELKSIISHAIKLFGYNCDLNWIDVSSITDMEGLFKGHEWNYKNKHKFNGDISKWDVSKITDMHFMFGCSRFNRDISLWDVSNVTDMDNMFHNSKFNRDISLWDVSNVTNMKEMFSYSEFNGDISNWDVSNVTNMKGMFEGNHVFNGDISQWNVSNVTNMKGMFEGSIFNSDISNWNIHVDCDIKNIFQQCPIKWVYIPKIKYNKKFKDLFNI